MWVVQLAGHARDLSAWPHEVCVFNLETTEVRRLVIFVILWMYNINLLYQFAS